MTLISLIIYIQVCFFVHSWDIFRESISIHISQCLEVYIFFCLYYAGCKTADKQKFNQNIVQVFTDEYKRAVVDPVALSCEFIRLQTCFRMETTQCSHHQQDYFTLCYMTQVKKSFTGCWVFFRLKCSIKLCIFIFAFASCLDIVVYSIETRS